MLYDTIAVYPNLEEISINNIFRVYLSLIFLMNMRSCVVNVVYFYFNNEYMEDISNMICHIHKFKFREIIYSTTILSKFLTFLLALLGIYFS